MSPAVGSRTFVQGRALGAAIALVFVSWAIAHAQQPPPPTAPALLELKPLAVTQLDERAQADVLDGRTFTMSFGEPVPVKELLLMLVRSTNLSVVPDPWVDGAFIGDLKNVTLRQALDLILRPLGLDYSVQDAVVRVFKRRLETRFFDINYVTTRRIGSRSLGASSAAEPRQPVPGPATAGTPAGDGIIAGSSLQVTSSDRGDVFDDLAAGVGTLLTPEGRFNIDRKAGLLQVHDLPDRLDRVGIYLEAVQTRINRQVQIQAHVIEIELNDQFADGVNWELALKGLAASPPTAQSPAPRPSVAVVSKIDDFGALLRALSMQGRVNVLSSPRVTAMNNEPAVMRVGTQDVFFVTTAQVDAATGRARQTTVAPQSITEGITLSVTPQIASDGIVNLSISPSITERTGQARSRLGDTVPVMRVREADTLVRVLQGDTVVLGGLMQPSLGNPQGFGAMFRGESRVRRKTDLIILLTPTVMSLGQAALAPGR